MNGFANYFILFQKKYSPSELIHFCIQPNHWFDHWFSHLSNYPKTFQKLVVHTPQKFKPYIIHFIALMRKKSYDTNSGLYVGGFNNSMFSRLKYWVTTLTPCSLVLLQRRRILTRYSFSRDFLRIFVKQMVTYHKLLRVNFSGKATVAMWSKVQKLKTTEEC